ncbi:hypothetical protein E2C01_014785 [Portunus trituberculatus]|uniref:Uncharacterized protein n=1 Tax=Portunus trituberculatus TaxID=210409 RepID=A0A5B7DK06_PORTR|nr:hypothetical protein [Portunus trituberculatus]
MRFAVKSGAMVGIALRAAANCGLQNRHIVGCDGQRHQGREDTQFVCSARVMGRWVEESNKEGIAGSCVHHLAQVLAQFSHHHKLLHRPNSLPGDNRKENFTSTILQDTKELRTYPYLGGGVTVAEHKLVHDVLLQLMSLQLLRVVVVRKLPETTQNA